MIFHGRIKIKYESRDELEREIERTLKYTVDSFGMDLSLTVYFLEVFWVTWVKCYHRFVTVIMTTHWVVPRYVPEKLHSLIRKVTSQNMHFRKVNLQNTRSQKQCPRPKMLTQILRIPLNLTQKLKNQILLLTILGLAADNLENWNFHFSLTSQVFSSEFFLLHF